MVLINDEPDKRLNKGATGQAKRKGRRNEVITKITKFKNLFQREYLDKKKAEMLDIFEKAY